MIIGITGGIGCGKSEVLNILDGLDWQTLDCDFIAHSLLLNPKFIREVIEPRFGSSVFDAEGNVNRKQIAEIIFSDDEQRRFLNQSMHPIILSNVRVWKDEIRKLNQNGAVAMPLLFETNFTEEWDAIVCLASDEKMVEQRLLGRGWSLEHIQKRLLSQFPLETKIELSTDVIYNNGSLIDLYNSVVDTIDSIGLKFKTV